MPDGGDFVAIRIGVFGWHVTAFSGALSLDLALAMYTI